MQPLPGSEVRSLRFRYPLAGNFEFAFEATDSGHAEFGGQSFPRPEPQARGVTPSQASGGAGSEENMFHRHRVRVGANKVQCWIDGELVYESEDVGRAHPWLTLSADMSTGRTAVFRNLALTGSGKVFPGVDLLDGSRTSLECHPLDTPGSGGCRRCCVEFGLRRRCERL